MDPRHVALVSLLAAMGSGLMAGVFFAFSTFVMPALAALPPAQGAAAMQAINAAALNRWLLGALFGTALACLALAAAAALGPASPAARLRLLGAAAYLLGVLAVTAACNVPRNEALAALGLDAPGLPGAWQRYLGEWTAWNHVRCAAALLAALALAAARE